jgi:hypothetical protein
MRNPNLDYKTGLIDLWYVETDAGAITIGECDNNLKKYLESRQDELTFRPSRSVMRFTGNDVVGIGDSL